MSDDKVIVFAGPSFNGLAPSVPFEIRPPARCGDVTRAVADRPKVIGIIDGVFEAVAAVWHKEIVYALQERIVVCGAASIGALRAVELESFGMIGIGEVFEMYRSGTIEDDDEVAVLHGPEEMQFKPVTEAMVNVRAVCNVAQKSDVLTSEDQAAICAAAKSLFYKDRTWSQIIRGATTVKDDVLTRFNEWRRAARRDIKQADALRLLDAILENNLQAPVPPPILSRTYFWQQHEQRFLMPSE